MLSVAMLSVAMLSIWAPLKVVVKTFYKIDPKKHKSGWTDKQDLLLCLSLAPRHLA